MAGDHQEKVEAVKAFAADYLDLYCSSTGVHHEVAVALFDELAKWFAAGEPEKGRRGIVRTRLARDAHIELPDDLSERRLKLSVLDKALRTIAQNLQIFGHRQAELPSGTKRSSWRLDPRAVEHVGGVDEDRCTFPVDGDARILRVKGPVAEARGDTDTGRYYFVATFEPMGVEVAAAFDQFLRESYYSGTMQHWVAAVDAFLPRLRGLLSNPLARQYDSSARQSCLVRLRDLPRQMDEARREVRTYEQQDAEGSSRYPGRMANFAHGRLTFLEKVLDTTRE